MIIEDDLQLAGVYKMRLEAEGFEVMHCADAEQALKEVKKYQPRLILLDLMLPGVSGYDVLDMLKALPEIEAKIVILSALAEAGDIEKAKTLGADGYLVKSQVTLADVVAYVKKQLGMSTSVPGQA
jgi:DNA-binding response OmpR family regulator